MIKVLQVRIGNCGILIYNVIYGVCWGTEGCGLQIWKWAFIDSVFRDWEIKSWEPMFVSVELGIEDRKLGARMIVAVRGLRVEGWRLWVEGWVWGSKMMIAGLRFKVGDWRLWFGDRAFKLETSGWELRIEGIGTFAKLQLSCISSMSKKDHVTFCRRS